jgi:large subunit ribosomal protein L21
LKPRCPQAWFFLGSASRQTDQFANAIDALKHATTLPHRGHRGSSWAKGGAEVLGCSKLKVYSSGSGAVCVRRPSKQEISPEALAINMHAIIETGGKQYRVAPGDVIRVEKLAGEVGSEIELPVKAAFNDGGELVAGGTVKATIVGSGRGDKVLVFKFKRKKQYKKTIGHRQSFTEVKVGEIVV